jgi:tetratricopeptide (TPR) repeat protein
MPPARAAASRALELDDALAEAHLAYAWVSLLFDWNWTSAETHVRRALELSPNYADAHTSMAAVLGSTGRLHEAMEHAKTAVVLAPVAGYSQCGNLAAMAGRHEEAITHYRRALEFEPAAATPLYHLPAEYAHLGMFDEAVHAHVRSTGNNELEDVYREKGYHAALAAYAGKLVERARLEYVSPFWIAETYALAGETEKALTWLDKAYEERDPPLALIRLNNYFNSIRSEPRYKELERRIGLPD